jgi:NAD(P)-dependent dehydrogenase (short-subunit alcohol dehydrogenase family)
VNVENTRIVVTGAASGIGRALCQRFAAQGAKRVVAVDLNEAGAKETAANIGGVGMGCDVADEVQVSRVIERVEAEVGPIDLFCSNAGIASALDLEAPNEEWQRSWDVNVMAHVYAARHLLPRMVERGGGYFLQTASAAGLLNMISGAAYGVTKHAAVGFGEWLALTYAHRGIKVSLLCPQAVRTGMTQDATPGSAAAAGDGLLEPEAVADSVLAGLQSETFLILPHPDVLKYARAKTADYDRWIQQMNALHRRVTGR